jgi:hypothetical protein
MNEVRIWIPLWKIIAAIVIIAAVLVAVVRGF